MILCCTSFKFHRQTIYSFQSNEPTLKTLVPKRNGIHKDANTKSFPNVAIILELKTIPLGRILKSPFDRQSKRMNLLTS